MTDNNEVPAVKEEATAEVADVKPAVDEDMKQATEEDVKPAAASIAPADAGAPEDASYGDNEDYKEFRSKGINAPVATALIQLIEETDMTKDDVDERAVEMLQSFPNDQAAYILNQMKSSKLFGVQNKAQYLMSIMRNFKDRVRQLGLAHSMANPLIVGPDMEKMKSFLESRGYSIEVTLGQRKYGGPCPDWDGPATGPVGTGHEVYIGHIPHELYEDNLVTLFETEGKIWDMRLMMDPMTGRNRGYAFLTFTEKANASAAAKKFDGHEILPGKKLKVNVSIANTRLFVGNIPKSKSKEDILEEFKTHSEGVVDVIIYTSTENEKNKNRGFCFVDFVDHKTASDVKRRIQTGKLRPFNCDLVVDWAEHQEEPDEETMAKVKVVYVRNLKEVVTEDNLKELFGAYGEIERIKKVKDYAFIHYTERENAEKAIAEQNGKEIEGVAIEVSLAKPMNDKKKRMSRGGPMGSRGGPRGGGDYRGGRNMYPNRGYDDYGSYGGAGGGYGDWGAGAGSYGGGGGGGYGDWGHSSYGTGGYGGGGGGSYGGYGDYGGGYGGGGYGGGSGYGGYGGGRGGGMPRGGRGAPRGGGGMGGGRGRGRGGPRGAKRPGDWSGGPASKRGDGMDFSSDVPMGGF